MPLVTSGVENGNLRELCLQRMRDLGTECRDVRTREVGIQDIHHRIRPDQVELIRRDYTANGGWETFLSYEDPEQDILIGLLRLRKCADMTFRPELTKEGCGGQCSIVRELHVYGSVVPVACKDMSKFQHQVGPSVCARRQVVDVHLCVFRLECLCLLLSITPGLRYAAHGGSGAHRSRGAWIGEVGRDLWRGYAELLPEVGLRAGWAVHEQVVEVEMLRLKWRCTTTREIHVLRFKWALLVRRRLFFFLPPSPKLTHERQWNTAGRVHRRATTLATSSHD